MEYHDVDPEALSPTADHPCDRRSISEAGDLSILAAAVYEMEPGEQLARTYHYHDQREELFYVLAGTLAVDTPDKQYEISPGSVFVATPKSPHRPHNPGDAEETVRVLGVGAPSHDIGRPFDPATDSLPSNSTTE